MLQAVLFDFNGVLVDDEALHLAGFNAALAPRGIVISPEAYDARYIGFDDRGAFTAMLADHGEAPSAASVAALIAAKSVVYADLAARSLRVFDGAAALVRAAAEVAPVAIVSGALRGEIDVALALMGVAGCVRTIVAAEDVAACKPDPEGYRLGLARLAGDLDAARCVALEDSVAGIAAARGAGLAVVGVAHSHPAAMLREAGATLVAERIGDVDVGLLGAAVHRR